MHKLLLHIYTLAATKLLKLVGQANFEKIFTVLSA